MVNLMDDKKMAIGQDGAKMASIMAQLNAQDKGPKGLSSKDKQARTVARLLLVQALYQMELSGIGAEAVIREFADFRDGSHVDAEQSDLVLGAADHAFFAEGIRTLVAEQLVIDHLVVDRLASGWRMERLDTTLRAILRSGAWELKFRPDIGTEVIINEYVEIAKAFFGQTEAKFVNGALDGIATDVR